jgi:hypothetical protein
MDWEDSVFHQTYLVNRKPQLAVLEEGLKN